VSVVGRRGFALGSRTGIELVALVGVGWDGTVLIGCSALLVAQRGVVCESIIQEPRIAQWLPCL
jgi:hypothetical protein